MPILGSPESEAGKRLAYGERAMPSPEQDLRDYLNGEFRHGRPLVITGRRCDAVGRQLTDRMVSRAEIQRALGYLSHRQQRAVQLTYSADQYIRPDRIAQLLGISKSTYYSELSEAIRQMAKRIYEWS